MGSVKITAEIRRQHSTGWHIVDITVKESGKLKVCRRLRVFTDILAGAFTDAFRSVGYEIARHIWGNSFKEMPLYVIPDWSGPMKAVHINKAAERAIDILITLDWDPHALHIWRDLIQIEGRPTPGIGEKLKKAGFNLHYRCFSNGRGEASDIWGRNDIRVVCVEKLGFMDRLRKLGIIDDESSANPALRRGKR